MIPLFTLISQKSQRQKILSVNEQKKIQLKNLKYMLHHIHSTIKNNKLLIKQNTDTEQEIHTQIVQKAQTINTSTT